MKAKIADFIQKNRLLKINQPIILGFSGGADSLALAHVLCALDYDVICAHFDHQLRPESGQVAEQARGLAQSLGVRFTLGAGDVRAYQKKHALSIEEAARVLRYPFLFAQAHTHAAQAVVTGHHADDQAETVLMHLLRGAGLDGLRGMLPRVVLPDWDARTPLVRPLLGVTRSEIEAYIRAHHLTPLDDPSNTDTTLFRNRVRHVLLPNLEKEYNPQIRTQLTKLAHTLQGDADLLGMLGARGFDDAALPSGEGYVGLRRAVLREMSRALQARVLRHAFGQSWSRVRDFGFEAVARGLDAIAGAAAWAQVDLVGGVKLFVEQDVVWLAEREGALPLAGVPQITNQMHLDFGETAMPGGWVLSMERVAVPAGGVVFNKNNPNQIYLNPERLRTPLIVRPRVAGERLRPFGMGGRSMKLSDYMINEKIAQRARKNWPVVVCGAEVVWVVGHALGDAFALPDGARDAVVLSLRRAGGLGV